MPTVWVVPTSFDLLCVGVVLRSVFGLQQKDKNILELCRTEKCSCIGAATGRDGSQKAMLSQESNGPNSLSEAG